MDQMTHRERCRTALAGGEVDRTPISLWRHFGAIDMTADGLAESMIAWQRSHDFDFVKFMPTGTYTIMDWGARTTWQPNDVGIRTVVEEPVRRPDDWGRLAPLDTQAGVLGMVNAALSRTVASLGPDVPVFQTIFSPLATARKLGGGATLAHLRQHPERFAAGMATIEAMTARLIADAVERGADLFYVLQAGTADVLCADEFQRWEAEPARRLLAAIPRQTMVLLHSHGDHLWFDELADWPVHGVNWHDRTGGPSLAEARSRVPHGLVGGLDARRELREGTVADVTRAVRDAIGAVPRGLIIGPGCVIPTDAAPHLVAAARAAVEPDGGPGGDRR